MASSMQQIFRQRGLSNGPRNVDSGSQAKESGAIAYCLVKSRPYGGHSYDEMTSAAGSIEFGQSHTLIMLPQIRESTSIPVIDKLRTILADEATLLDAKTRSVWCLQLDPLTVMNTLSQLGFRASHFDINAADGVHTWTLACSGKNALKKAIVQKVAVDAEHKTAAHANSGFSNDTSLEDREQRTEGHSGATNGHSNAGMQRSGNGDEHASFSSERRSLELSNLYEQSSHADYDVEDDDDDFSLPSENEDETHGGCSAGVYSTNASLSQKFVASDSKKPFVRKSLELMPSTTKSFPKQQTVGSVGSAEYARSINKSGARRRPRTNIQPEQYDYMFQQFSRNSNPSRAHISAIADRLGLSGCVVRVWFQNARALERRGVLKIPQQTINKRCPMCQVRFSARSSMEQHILTKHPDSSFAKSSALIDRLPSSDTEGINEEPISSLLTESLPRAEKQEDPGEAV